MLTINDINNYISKINNFKKSMIVQFNALKSTTLPQWLPGHWGFDIINVKKDIDNYIHVLQSGKGGLPPYHNQGISVDQNNILELSPQGMINFVNNYKYSVTHPGNYLTSGQKTGLEQIQEKYQEFINYWNSLYQKEKNMIDSILNENSTYHTQKKKTSPTQQKVKYTYIIQDNNWYGLKGYTVTINGKTYTTNNSGAVTVELKKGTNPAQALTAVKNPLGVPINFKLVLNKGTTLTYHVPRTWPLKSPCTAENPCYHFTTYNWHESDSTVKYTKDWKGNWILTESPAFKDISKIILVWWNGDSHPQDTKFSFLTLYDKASQRKSDPTQFFYYGVNPTIHMSLFGYAKAVIYTVLTNGKIIAYGPLTDYSNENAVSQIVPSYPTYPNYRLCQVFAVKLFLYP